MNTPLVFVHHDGPKLRRSQISLVRSTAMYVTRMERRNAASRTTGDTSEESTMEICRVQTHRTGRQIHRIAGSRTAESYSSKLARQLGQPPQYPQTTTGIDGKLYQDYIRRTDTCADAIDEAFLLVGFRKQSLYKPEPDKKLCVYIGWLFASALTDAIRGGTRIVYPYEELIVVRELQVSLASQKSSAHVITPIMFLSLFEIVRLGSHATTHMAALKRVVDKEQGANGLDSLVSQKTVMLIDLLHAISFDKPLQFVDEFDSVSRVQLPHTDEGNYFAGSPLVLFNGEDFSSLRTFVDAEIAAPLAAILQLSFGSIEQLYLDSANPVGGISESRSAHDMFVYVDEYANSYTSKTDAARIMLQSCAIGSRIYFRTLAQLTGFQIPSNADDSRTLYNNLRFLGLRSWAGLPYIYAWLLLIGVSTATEQERPFFVGQLTRIAASFGGYHLEILSSLGYLSTPQVRSPNLALDKHEATGAIVHYLPRRTSSEENSNGRSLR